MADLVVNPNVKIVNRDAKVWVAHAGVGKRFFDYFKEQKVVFLDLPKLQLVLGDKNNSVFLKQKVLMSEKIREYLLFGGQSRASERAPSFNFRDYDPSMQTRHSNAQVGNVRAMFYQMRSGDLVIIPPRGGSYGEVLFGEIVGEFDPLRTVEPRGIAGYEVQTRGVRWLQRSPEKRLLSPALSRRLENRHAVIEVSDLGLRKEAYSFAYQNVIADDFSKIEIESLRYNSKDVRYVIGAFELVGALSAIFSIVNSGGVVDKSDDAKNLYKHRMSSALIDDFKVQFSSPGKFTVISKNKNLIVYLMVAIPVLAALGPAASGLLGVGGTYPVLGPELSALPGMTPPLEALINSIAPSQLQELGQMAQEADRHIGLSTGTDIDPTQFPGMQ